jgi:hypothetical protein
VTGEFFRGRGESLFRERLVVAALALVGTYALFFEYLPPFARVHLWSDIAGYHYPLQAYAFDALKHHRIPLWDASIYSGISFVGNVQAAFLYPPTWLMYLAARHFPRLPFKALELFAFWHVWLAFCLGYLWLRNRAGIIPSALGASVFSFSGFLMWQLLHPGILGAAAWLPLGLWGVDEATERHDWRPLWKLAAASALAFLAGYPAAWLVNCVVWAVYAATGRMPLRAVLGVCGALAASGLLAMAQVLPVLEAHSLMQLEPKYGLGEWGLRTLLLSFFLPNWFDFNPGHPTDYEPGCLYLYLGIPGLFGLLYAISRGRWRPYLQPAVVLCVALFLANPPAEFVRLVERFPAVDQTLQPFNFYAAGGAMAALITALALDAFGKVEIKRRAPQWVIPAVAAVLALWAGRQLWIWVAARGHMPAHAGSILPAVTSLALFFVGLWALRGASGQRGVMLAGALLLATAVDYRVYSSGRWFNAQPGDFDAELDPEGIRGMNRVAYDALAANRNYRIICDEGASPYSTDLRVYGLATPQGFDPFLPAEYRRRIERWVPFRTNRVFFVDVKNELMLRRLGARYVITHEGAGNQPFLAKSPAFRRIGPDDSFYQVYEYLRAAPPYGWEDGRPGAVQVAAWKPERRDFLLESERAGRFTFVEQFYPGWRATVDGRPVPIERWDSTFQAIEVPAGAHRVRFLFRPASVEIGGAISLAALVGLAFVIAADRRARRKTRPGSGPPAEQELETADDGAAGHLHALNLLVGRGGEV